jgi:hypothetical protein
MHGEHNILFIRIVSQWPRLAPAPCPQVMGQ